ncbi:MAG: hypothetical protein ACRDRZ_17300 [Pseudonocardiaceae bacterium]
MIDLPPVPDSATGEPRPPRAPAVGRSDAAVPVADGRCKPDPPPGQGPVLEWSCRPWWWLWYVPLLWSAFMAAAATVAPLRWGEGAGFSWLGQWWICSIVVLPGILIVLIGRRRRLSVGADWCARGRRWVRTYELVRMEIVRQATGDDLLLEDQAGRVLRVRLAELQANPEMWDLVYNGVLHSAHSWEIDADDRTRQSLRLPSNAAPTPADHDEDAPLAGPSPPRSHRLGRRAGPDRPRG